MLKILGHYFATAFERYLPSSFVFAILLTLLSLIFAISLTPSGLMDVLGYWGDGLWNLNGFAMEMVLILVTGSALAKSPLVDRQLIKGLKYVNSQASGNLSVLTLSSFACLFNWGFGLIITGLFVLHIQKEKAKLDFAQLVASGYAGFVLWHGGLSGSIPLKLTNPSEYVKEIIGQPNLDLTETIFSSFNLFLIGFNFLAMSLFLYWVGNKFDKKNKIELNRTDDMEFNNEKTEDSIKGRPVDKLEKSKILMGIFVFLGGLYLIGLIDRGTSLNLKNLSFLFLFLGILLHKSLYQYHKVFGESVANSSGIILQFPLYAGIVAIMSESKLALQVSEFILSHATTGNFLPLTFWTAGLVNFFVPSGGGQWAIQAPIVLGVAGTLDISMAKTSMAIAWGDAWSNMVQPFWAIPLLSLAKVKLGSMMYYSFLIFLLTGLVSSVIFAII